MKFPYLDNLVPALYRFLNICIVMRLTLILIPQTCFIVFRLITFQLSRCFHSIFTFYIEHYGLRRRTTLVLFHNSHRGQEYWENLDIMRAGGSWRCCHLVSSTSSCHIVSHCISTPGAWTPTETPTSGPSASPRTTSGSCRCRWAGIILQSELTNTWTLG